MDDTKFLIPAGTEIQTRNTEKELRLRRHTTRQHLRFDIRLNSGDGGHRWFFKLGDWLIAVDSELVCCENEIPVEDETATETAT